MTHTSGPFKVTRAVRPDNTGGYDWAVSDMHDHIVAEFYEHVGWDDKREYMKLPARDNALLYAAASDLLTALQAANKIIAEAAATGFRWEKGDWAEHLFESQGATSAAIAKATGAI